VNNADTNELNVSLTVHHELTI